MKILNLYCGIGGNRALWGDEHEIVAIENVSHIAEVYRKLWPNDTVIEADAHQYTTKSLILYGRRHHVRRIQSCK